MGGLETQESLHPVQYPRPQAVGPQEDQAGLAFKAASAGRASILTPAAVMGLQRLAGNAGVGAIIDEGQGRSPVHDVVGSGRGEPLQEPLRSAMEAQLGHDFSDVRVHHDTKASESAKSVQAHAYTVGSDIVFQSGQYTPDTTAGQRMLAHELTHVVQQRSGPVDGTPSAGGIKISDPSDRFERSAEASADRVMAGIQHQEEEEKLQTSAVQRQEEEEELQTSGVQRQEEEEEL